MYSIAIRWMRGTVLLVLSLAALLLVTALAEQQQAPPPEDCRSGNLGVPRHAAPPAPPHQGLLLRWKASAPASASKRDAVKGYYVYRRAPKDIYGGPMNSLLIQGTTCADPSAEPGKTYVYTTRAVSASDGLSKPAKEISAKVPHDHK